MTNLPATGQEIDQRLLRAFVAVAEELHFTRAAARLIVAQQALSRDIRRLEDLLGARLFDRTTRHVQLTVDGRRLLPLAREVLAAHDALLAQMLGAARPLLVDVVADGTTAARVLDRARELAPDVRFVARFGGGLGASLPFVISGQLDVAFGRRGAGLTLPSTIVTRHVSEQRLALFVRPDHPLARVKAVASGDLAGQVIDASVGNDAAPEWVEFAVAFLQQVGARASPAHPHAVGPAETARHLAEHGLPILTLVGSLSPPGAVAVPIEAGAPSYPWSMFWRRGFRHPGLTSLERAASEAGS